VTHHLDHAAPVWVQLDFEDYQRVIEATSGLRGAGELEHARGRHREAAEYERLAEQLAQVLAVMQTAYRASHPPGEEVKRPPESVPRAAARPLSTVQHNPNQTD